MFLMALLGSADLIPTLILSSQLTIIGTQRSSSRRLPVCGAQGISTLPGRLTFIFSLI